MIKLLALSIVLSVIVLWALGCPALAHAQDAPGPAPAPAPVIDPRDAADRRPSPAEPDFTTVNLPTTLRLPRHESSFRMAHRFTRTLNNPSFGDLAGNLFGLDAAPSSDSNTDSD